MTYPSIKETSYHASGLPFAVLVVPHGADSNDFFRFFPEIEGSPEMQSIWPVFLAYLEIERDRGAQELAHALACQLAYRYDIRSLVIELNYPRGLVDGGRLRHHGLRDCLPSPLATELRDPFLAVHQDSLDYMDRLYESMALKNQCFLLDIHTMASFCPADPRGQRHTFPVSFPRLGDYVEQYRQAHIHALQRKIDLICADEQGRTLADPCLLASIKTALEEENYECLENEPYHAAPIYLSYQHMQKVPSLSIDVPKDLVAFNASTPYDPAQLSIDTVRVQRLASCLARGMAKAFSPLPSG